MLTQRQHLLSQFACISVRDALVRCPAHRAHANSLLSIAPEHSLHTYAELTNVRLQEKHGAVFESDTDTEVVPKLLKYVYSQIDKLSKHQPTLPELVMEVMSQLEGAFALLIKSSHYPGELVAAKRGSPLIMGIRQGSITTLDGSVDIDMEASATGKSLELFLASDASAVVEHTNT